MNDRQSDQTFSRWWLTARQLEMPVACSGAEHRLRWRNGTLELLDHPDLDAELAMIALGGPEPACVSRFRLWEAAVDDGGFLGEWVDETRLSASWFSWLTMALERMRSEGFHEFLRQLPPARARKMGEFLHDFPLPWIDRAGATVSERVNGNADLGVSGVSCSLAPGLLREAISPRVRRAFVDAVGGRELAVGAAALVSLSIIVGDRPAVSGLLTGPYRGVELVVPARWLHEVWAADAAVIDGRLILALAVAEDLSAEALAVHWVDNPDGMTPLLQPRTVRFTNGRWV